MEQLNKPYKILFEESHNINKGRIGYIDREGNFYQISTIEEHNYWLGKQKGYLFAGINARNILLSLNLNEEEKEAYKKRPKVEGHETGFFPWNWSAHNFLIEKGFCLFFRGIDDERVYVDYSEYQNASLNQLLIMDYLYFINPATSTDEREKGADIKKRIRTLKQKI